MLVDYHELCQNSIMIYLGADHRGFELKQRLLKSIQDKGLEITDLGNDHLDPNDDYVLYAQKVAEAVSSDEKNRGILLCGSGVGVDIVANKIDGVRSALVDNVHQVIQARADDNVNIVSLPADTLDEETAMEIIQAFLETEFKAEERFERRLDQIKVIEEDN